MATLRFFALSWRIAKRGFILEQFFALSVTEKTKDEFNPPVRLDEMTLLIDVRCMQNTLTYFYMLDFNDMDM